MQCLICSIINVSNIIVIFLIKWRLCDRITHPSRFYIKNAIKYSKVLFYIRQTKQPYTYVKKRVRHETVISSETTTISTFFFDEILFPLVPRPINLKVTFPLSREFPSKIILPTLFAYSTFRVKRRSLITQLSSNP